MNTRKLLLLCLLFTILVGSSACSAIQPVSQAYAQSTPYALPILTAQRPPLRPSPTAAIFEYQPTSTPRPSPTPGHVLTATPWITSYGPTNFPLNINPLTGMPALDSGLLERRPMAIKITNFPRRVRPQWGLSLADHVYEYYLEDGMTRFIAVFYGRDAERVGPIRSARMFDEHIVRMYKAIFAFGYGDDPIIEQWVESDIRNSLVIERANNCPPMCRIGPEGDYNTLYTNSQQLSQYITERGTNNDRPNLDGLYFSIPIPFGGQAGSQVAIRYSRVSHHRWEYDPASHQYLRWQDMQEAEPGAEVYSPLVDSLTGQQVAADNLIILYIPHTYFIKSNSTESLQMEFGGKGQPNAEGNGLALRDGKAYPIRWKRSAVDAIFSLVNAASDAPYALKPGNVWFEVLGVESTSTQPATGVWQFNFDIP